MKARNSGGYVDARLAELAREPEDVRARVTLVQRARLLKWRTP